MDGCRPGNDGTQLQFTKIYTTYKEAQPQDEQDITNNWANQRIFHNIDIDQTAFNGKNCNNQSCCITEGGIDNAGKVFTGLFGNYLRFASPRKWASGTRTAAAKMKVMIAVKW